MPDTRREALNQNMSAIWSKFLPVQRERLDQIDTAIRMGLRGELAPEIQKQGRHAAHKLVGSLGTFGFWSGSKLARQIEEALAEDALPLPRLYLLAELAESLRTLVKDELPIAESLSTRKTIQVATKDTHLAEALQHDIELAGWHAVFTEDWQAELGAEVLILDTRGLEDDLARANTAFLVPTLLLTSDMAIDRVSLLGRGVAHFADWRTPSPELVATVKDLLKPPTAGRILAVDDDPAVLAVIRRILEEVGCEVETLDDPCQFWPVLETSRPDLMILDMEMPGASGLDLLALVRRENRWRTLPVLFLTTAQDPELVQRLFEEGADDFVRKPILAKELETRVQNRLERTRLWRRLAETDPLTGVANRLKSVQILEQFLSLAKRHGQPFSMAVLDLDHFKAVNDRFGHAVGDQVLTWFGERLLQGFRHEDVVARWGGEEFVIGMYGMSVHDGIQRLNDLLTRITQEVFETAAGPLDISFSAGVAVFPDDGDTLNDLYQAADRALYGAKRAGRSRVEPCRSMPSSARVDVLIVEDDPMQVAVLRHALEARGYTVASIDDGQAAYRALFETGTHSCRVMVLDVDLPGISGLTLLRKLKEADRVRECRVVILTARSGEQDTLAAMEEGAFDYVAKPYSLPILMQRIRRALGR